MRRLNTILVIGAGALAATAMGLANAAETVTYTYDSRGRLVKIEHSGTINNGVVSNYTFDKADNRTNVKVSGAP
ncbi:MAG: hypothetical protein V4610_06310 [Pseudomonadota bacterium]|jgi:hypothetical protein